MIRALGLLVFFASAACGSILGGYVPQNGDVIFQSFPHNPLTDAIESASQSPYSHCGLVVATSNGFAVLEAVGPVIRTPLENWIHRGRDHHFAVYRFTAPYRGKIPEIIAGAEAYLGKPYDIHYSFDDRLIYCSELVFKGFKKATNEELGKVKRLGDLNWRPNEAFIRKLENGALPLDREMITPKDLSEAKQLTPIYKSGF